MNDLISRQAAIDLIDEYMDKSIELHFLPTGEGIKALMFSLPSAQPERKVGKWILADLQIQAEMDNGNYCYNCSNCGKADIHAKSAEVPFCWWCGARMEGEEE
jgi:hypothetical protein